jgi:probable nitrogen fixation protein
MPLPMMQLSHEGYGRIVLIAGRLVILSRNVRDVHRFGFDSLADLAVEGDAMIAEALAMLERYPDVARL